MEELSCLSLDVGMQVVALEYVPAHTAAATVEGKHDITLRLERGASSLDTALSSSCSFLFFGISVIFASGVGDHFE